MIDLELDLARLGDRLALDDDGLVDDVLTRIAVPPGETAPSHRWMVAVAVVLAVAAAALLVPSSREAIADWFGLDGVRIEQRPVPADVADDLPAVITVDEFDGSLDEAVTKVLGADTSILRVDVGGLPGLWIDGEPHQLVLRDPDGGLSTRRFAGNTLLWQDGDVIRRVEGFSSLDDALAFARARPD